MVFAGVTQDPSGFFTFKQELVDTDPIAQAIQSGETTRQLESLTNFFLPQLNVSKVSTDLFARVRDGISETFSSAISHGRPWMTTDLTSKWFF